MARRSLTSAGGTMKVSAKSSSQVIASSCQNAAKSKKEGKTVKPSTRKPSTAYIVIKDPARALTPYHIPDLFGTHAQTLEAVRWVDE
jgi:hypothetical protein